MKNILFYDPHSSGHHIEYFYHLVKYKKEKRNKNKWFFLVSTDFCLKFNEIMDIKELEKLSISIHKLDEIMNDFTIFNQSIKNYKEHIVKMNDFISDFNINHIIFMFLDNPLQIVLGSKYGRNLNCSFSGIILNPFAGFGDGVIKYYYKFRKLLQYLILISNKKLKNIYIITDKKSVKILNKIYFTKKFLFVTDPILVIENNSDSKISNKNSDRTNFLLFGSLNKRKGIYTVIDALFQFSVEDLKKIKIYFIGKINEKDAKTFEGKLALVKRKDPNSVELVNKYVSFKELNYYFNLVDYILLPYESTQASSGILGHAASHFKPIIGQGGGLFQKHIEQYGLGKVIENLDSQKLYNLMKSTIENQKEIQIDKKGIRDYLDLRSSNFFADNILTSIGLDEKT